MVDEKTYNEMLLASVTNLLGNWMKLDVMTPELVLRDAPQAARTLYQALLGMTTATIDNVTVATPQQIEDSVMPDYMVCLEDGKKFKSLKRHLMTHYNLTPDQYRAKWGLPADYPMVAPNYAETRSMLAKNSGLGRKGR